MSISTSRSASSTLAGIHLVAAAVAELRRGVGGLAERAVEPRAVLHRVRHDADAVEAALVEGRADGGDAAVHHVRRRHEVGAGGGVRQRGLHQPLHGGVVDDLVAFDDAAVAVRRVLAQAHVGHHHQRRRGALQRANRFLHRRVRRPTPAIQRRPCALGRPNSITARMPSPAAASASRTASSTDSCDTPGIDEIGRAHAAAFADEERIDERVGRQPRLADQRADGLGAAEPPGPARQVQPGGSGGGHESRSCHEAALARDHVRHDGVDQRRHGVGGRLHRHVDAEPAGRFRGDRPDGRHDGLLQQVRRLLGAEHLGEVADRRGAREGDDLDLAVEQHPVDVGPAVGLPVVEHGAIGDDVGDERTGVAQLLGDDLAADVGARQQHAHGVERAARLERAHHGVGLELGRNEIDLDAVLRELLGRGRSDRAELRPLQRAHVAAGLEHRVHERVDRVGAGEDDPVEDVELRGGAQQRRASRRAAGCGSSALRPARRRAPPADPRAPPPAPWRASPAP